MSIPCIILSNIISWMESTSTPQNPRSLSSSSGSRSKKKSQNLMEEKKNNEDYSYLDHFDLRVYDLLIR